MTLAADGEDKGAVPVAAPVAHAQGIRVHDDNAKPAQPKAKAASKPKPSAKVAPAPPKDFIKVNGVRYVREGAVAPKTVAAPTTKAADEYAELGENITKLGEGAIEVVKQEGARLVDRLLGVASDSMHRIQDKKR